MLKATQTPFSGRQLSQSGESRCHRQQEPEGLFFLGIRIWLWVATKARSVLAWPGARKLCGLPLSLAEEAAICDGHARRQG